jgi:hypothetical protein
MRDIDYKTLSENLDTMINLLEYDAMRSPGKAKVNADTLVNLFSLKDRYAEAIKPPVPQVATVTEAPKKTVGRPAKSNN